MCRLLLAINHLYPVRLAQAYQRRQSDFAGIALAAKHALAKHGSPQGYAIQATHHLAIYPCFNAMRQATLVQLAVGANHVRSYPCAALPRTRRGALLHHCFKCRIHTNAGLRLAAKLAQSLAQRRVQAKLLGA